MCIAGSVDSLNKSSVTHNGIFHTVYGIIGILQCSIKNLNQSNVSLMSYNLTIIKCFTCY